MSNKQFISVLRDYAAAANRRHVSYAEQVKHVVELRIASLTPKDATPEQVQAVTNEQRGIALREYGRSDSALAFEAVS